MDATEGYAEALVEVLRPPGVIPDAEPQTPSEALVQHRLDYLERRCYAQRER